MQEDREEREKFDRRQKIAPWISYKQWQAIDKLSTIPPFNQPNRLNMEATLAQHVENNPEQWFKYVNDREFLDMAMNKAAEAEEEKKIAKRKLKRKLTRKRF